MKRNDTPTMTVRQIAAWAWRAASGQRRRIVAVCALGLLRVCATLSFIWVSKMLIDAATMPSTADSRIWWLAIVLAGCMLLEMVFAQIANYTSATTNQRLANALRRRIYAELLDSDTYADRKHTGDILNRLTIDVNKVCDTLTNTVPSIVIMSAQLLAAFWLMVVMSPLLGLCALLITPIGKLISKIYIKRMRRLNREIRDGDSQIHANVQEGLQHRIVVQTLECAPQMQQRLDTLQRGVMSSAVSRARVSLFSRSTMRIGLITGYLIAFVWCVFQLHAGSITFGMMTAFLQLVARIQNPISSLTGALPALLDSATAIERLNDISCADADRGADAPHDADTHGLPVGVRIKDVSFAYDDATDVISGFSHDFTPGSRTVIMGETGVGKSTLTKLILALLQPQEGTIDVYTTDADGTQRWMGASVATRRYMTYVPQGNSLLQGTIRDNLLLGNPQADDRAMREALHTAVADFVWELPMGLDTPCGELGSGLSEGQCQRIAIARALLRDANVLILDEFNSSLDQQTAAMLIERLDASRPGATIIYISHRPEVADHCSDVVRM